MKAKGVLYYTEAKTNYVKGGRAGGLVKKSINY